MSWWLMTSLSFMAGFLVSGWILTSLVPTIFNNQMLKIVGTYLTKDYFLAKCVFDKLLV